VREARIDVELRPVRRDRDLEQDVERGLLPEELGPVGSGAERTFASAVS
jgi:hypothetical protein